VWWVGEGRVYGNGESTIEAVLKKPNHYVINLSIMSPHNFSDKIRRASLSVQRTYKHTSGDILNRHMPPALTKYVRWNIWKQCFWNLEGLLSTDIKR